MEQFIQGFVDEALQLIENLDGLLVDVDDENISKTETEEIFRVMHTIKGSAGMFAFHNTEAITHKLEDVFDLIRSNELKISADIVTITLKASDVIKDLLHHKDELFPEVKSVYNIILVEIEDLLPTTKQVEEKVLVKEDSEISEKSSGLYYIKFNPDQDVLKRGLAVPNLLEELNELGEVSGLPILKNIPLPDNFDPALFYLSWDLFITTKFPSTNSKIVSCFIWIMNTKFSILKRMS